MKARLFRRTLLMLATAAVTLTACDNNDDPFYANSTTALVTVRPVEGGSFTMQLDHATALAPANLSQSPFGSKEVRALVNYTPVESERSNMRMVNVNWIDSIRTKMPVRDMGAQNDRLYGNDPVEIVRDWVSEHCGATEVSSITSTCSLAAMPMMCMRWNSGTTPWATPEAARAMR